MTYAGVPVSVPGSEVGLQFVSWSARFASTPANVRFFERLGWCRRGEPELYVGLPHQLMSIDLRVRVGARSPARS